MTSAQDPRIGAATQADAGRACPYCRFPIKEGAQVAVCGVCNAPHHSECWQENGGCAVVACAGGPGAAGERTAVMPPAAAGATHVAPSAPASGYAATAPPPAWAPPPPRSRGNAWLIAAVVVLALAAGGAATAFVLQTKNTPVALTAPAPPTVTQTTTVRGEPASTSAPPPVSPWGGETRSQMTDEITQLLYTWHEDIVSNDDAAAWDLLSKRKQQQNLVKYGYATWVKNQQTLAPYLDPSGIQVQILSTDWSRREVTVDVTGMTWSAPSARCSEWSGVTWVVWENGAWRYEPGYSTTPRREAMWKPRYSELLGTQC